MNNLYIVLPVVFQFFTAIVLMFFWTSKTAQRLISIIFSTVSLAVAVWLLHMVWNHGILTTQAGNWPAPFGISFVADTFSALMVLLTSISGFAVSLFSAGSMRNTRIRFGYFPVLHFLLMGLNGAFLTGDIFNLYVWFEIIIIASFVLITMGGEKEQIEGSLKYVTMNLLASVVFLTAIAILYGLTGSLNMADLANKVADLENRGLVNVTAILFFTGFGIKSAIFPLYFWLPASYHTPPSAVSAIFAGLLTKVGVYALVRIFTLIFVPDTFMINLILGIAVLSIITGGVGALVHVRIRKIFSYLIVCHIGYMIAGLGMYTELAITGVVFYLAHDIIVKTNLFLISGLIFRIKGSYNMKHLGGFYKNYPKLSLLMAVSLFSLVGVPPLSGFWAKLFWIEAGYEAGNYLPVAFIIIGSFLTLFIITRLWAEIFWKEGVEIRLKPYVIYFNDLRQYRRIAMVSAVAVLSLVSLYVGLGAENIIRASRKVAGELMNPEGYIQAVLEDQNLNEQQ